MTDPNPVGGTQTANLLPDPGVIRARLEVVRAEAYTLAQLLKLAEAYAQRTARATTATKEAALASR